MKQAAAKNNRRSKNFDHGKMQERSLEMDAKHDNQARRIVAQARARLPLRVSQNEIEKRAQEAVTFARDNALKTEAVADMRTVRIDALRRNLGLTNVAAVTAELQRRQESGEFKPSTAKSTNPKLLQTAWWQWKRKISRPCSTAKITARRWSKQSASMRL